MKNNETDVFTFSHQIWTFEVRVDFLDIGNLHKKLYKHILK